MLVIGISGPPCCGKDTAAEYLADKFEFDNISTGDLLRDQARLLGVSTDRISLQLLGSRLRDENSGKDPLFSKAMQECTGNTIFTGIRTIEASQLILGHVAGRLLYIESEISQRYLRNISRNRDSSITYEEFIAHDQIEYSGGIKIDMALTAIRGLASKIIVNNNSLQEYYDNLDNFINGNLQRE